MKTIRPMTVLEKLRATQRRMSNTVVVTPHVYFTGYLFRDRRHDAELDFLARHLYRRYERGEVFLFQRRLGDFRYEYCYQERRAKRR